MAWDNPAMARRDVLERIDGHLARGNELFDSVGEQLDGVGEALRLSRLTREQSDAAHERLFESFTRLTRDIAERFARAEERTARALDRFDAALQSFDRKLDESIDESKSHREALFKILERLGPDGSSAAA
jgi:uncharacterized membrane protein YccC